MDYRDERDALRGRVDNLEQQLGEAQRELDASRGDDKPARIAQIERQMAEARRVLDQLGHELGELKGAPPPRPRINVGPALLAVGAVVMVASGAMAFLLTRRQPRAQPPPPPPVARPVPPAPRAPEVPAPAPVPRRTAHAVWNAKVTRGTGAAPAIGTSCTVEANLGSDKGAPHVTDLVVTCGGVPVYRSRDQLNGMSMHSAAATEKPGAPAGTLVYGLQYDDKGTRTGARNEASIDTTAGAGAVWRTSVPAFHLDLSVSPESAPVRGEPLSR